MSSLEPAIELSTYNQGELGVYGRPAKEYNVETDNVFKAFINKGRYDSTYFDRFDTVDELIQLMCTNYPSDIVDFNRPHELQYSCRKLEFLEDTLGFLLGHRRKMPLEQWMTLIDLDDDYMSFIERRTILDNIMAMREEICKSKYHAIAHTGLATYISMWCEKPGGVRDMAYSLYFYSLKPLKTNT